jgi:signal transduction histidine kinase
MLKTGMAGLNLSVIFHEAERGVRSLYQAIHKKHDIESIEQQASALMLMFEDIAGLLRQKSNKHVDVRDVIQTAARLSQRRFERHQVLVTYDIGDEDTGLKVRGSEELLLGALTNLIDNAIYWLRVRWPDSALNHAPLRRIHIAVTDDLEGGKSIIFADNGPGFQDDPDTLVRPFFTRRPDGMGIGLYFVSMAMQLNGGELVFPAKDDVDLPDGIDGAVSALYFPDNRIVR